MDLSQLKPPTEGQKQKPQIHPSHGRRQKPNHVISSGDAGSGSIVAAAQTAAGKPALLDDLTERQAMWRGATDEAKTFYDGGCRDRGRAALAGGGGFSCGGCPLGSAMMDG
eukprot:scaffold56389_cov75-Cyclotella_meneghiniana.AAC.14